MTAKELAQKLDGRDCADWTLTTEEEQADAKNSGLVIAYGWSDDCLEFEGAIRDELGAYEGRTVQFKDGQPAFIEENCEECPYMQNHMKGAAEITAVWHDEGNPCWTIETEILHETFKIYENGVLFCIGIVFSVSDAMGKPAGVDRNRWKGCKYCDDKDCPPLDWMYGLDHIFLNYKYCPICGKPMTEEAWEQLEQRIGENDGKID